MKPRVLIIIDTVIVGGPGKGLFQFIENASKATFDFQLCNFEYRNPRSREFIERAAEEQINLKLFRQNYRFDLSPILQAYRLAKHQHYNILQTHSTKAHLIAWLLRRVITIPWLAVAHGYTNEDWKIRIYNRLDRWLLNQADRVVAVSPLLHYTLSTSRGNKKPTELILNAVDENEIRGHPGCSEVRRHCNVKSSGLLIGAFGRLSPEKGQENLLIAFGKLKKNPATSLILVGDGLDRNKLENLAVELGISSRVFFHGHQKFMRDYYDAIDLLVLPSLSEGLPNVVLEAMALGKPVLSTDVGAIREVISAGDNGWIVPPGDTGALSRALDEILSEPDNLKKFGIKARESLFPKFSPVERVKKFARLYELILKN